MPIGRKSVDLEAERKQRLSLTALVDQPEAKKPRYVDERHRSDFNRQALAQRVENVVRMNVTSECRGYDPRVVARRMGPVMELIEVIRARPAQEDDR